MKDHAIYLSFSKPIHFPFNTKNTRDDSILPFSLKAGLGYSETKSVVSEDFQE
ncbi:hypothetical protein [Chondrinema litorale]|uniref:hypothetical protein n=1 Tax=Chondrinema litorale TaxID=2994555 RepID=UPI0025433F29|nr:hypothetical protein [Chondrinema litorale]UZR96462.1 hypothetical protein OQ292_22655 [Chondrinema litorale]